MATFTKQLLSGSTNGKMIKVTGTNSAGSVTVHTAVSGVVNFDEVWVYAQNNDTAAVLLTIEYGGTSSPDDLVQASIPAKTGLFLMIPGTVLQNSQVIKAFAANANVISLVGWVNRITA